MVGIMPHDGPLSNWWMEAQIIPLLHPRHSPRHLLQIQVQALHLCKYNVLF